MTTPPIKTRKPTGRVPWPCILLEGEEKAGKSYALAQFSASDKVGTMYWIDLNEGAADEYGAIPGTRYEVVEHDGSYAQVLAAVQAIKAEAARTAKAGEPPVVLGIDTGTAIWDGLKDWASARAAKSGRNKELLKRDPNAEITISQNLWNDAGSRWRKLQTELLTFPGIVVVTARGKEVTEVDANGRPIEGRKTWSVQTHREFPYSATVWVRLRRGMKPSVIGARSVHVGIKPNDDPAREVTDPKAVDRLLEWLVFDALRCEPAKAHTRDLVEFHGGELLDHEKPPAEEPEAPAQAQGQRAQQSRPTAQPPTLEELLRNAQAATTGGALNAIANAAQAVLSVDDLAKVRDVVVARRAELQKQQEKTAAPTGNGEAPADQQPPVESAPDADDPKDCQLNAARRGVLSSLEAVGVSTEQLAERFGRPVQQVATRRLTALVREIITAQRAGSEPVGAQS